MGLDGWRAMCKHCKVQSSKSLLLYKCIMRTSNNFEIRKFVIGGVAIGIILIYMIRLFTLQLWSDDYKRMPTPTPSARTYNTPRAD